MQEKDIRQKIKDGYVRARVIFEMMGNPKEHVETTLKQFMQNIKQEPRIILLREEYAESEKMEQFWSTFCETEMLVQNLEVFTWLCINFTPASIEILEPEEFLVTNKDLGIWLNELLLRLHEIGIGYKQQSSENQLLKQNINALIRNAILLALNEPKSQEELCTTIGIDNPETVQPFFDAMIKEKRIIKDGDVYRRL